MVLVSGRFQVEGTVVHIDDLEQGLVVRLPCVHLDLLKEGRVHIVRDQTQLIADTHDHICLICLQCAFGEMSALIVEEAVTIAGPSNPLHQNSKQQIASKSHRFIKKLGLSGISQKKFSSLTHES